MKTEAIVVQPENNHSELQANENMNINAFDHNSMNIILHKLGWCTITSLFSITVGHVEASEAEFDTLLFIMSDGAHLLPANYNLCVDTAKQFAESRVGIKVLDDAFNKLTQSFGVQSPLDPGFFLNNLPCYSHSLKTGNFSTSKPFEVVKSELPSLQYPKIDLGSW
ncbi:hypothetical protein RYX36_022030, partial [Vicia faba]